ncbi:MAG: glycosyltransferase [Bacteroidetes bacterium]|nr:MAG: glycosyltransferase [Bacteroidota bacterium]
MLPVSVIIPARNEAANIGRLLASIQAQTQPPAEVIVVDGGSTDRTAEIAEAHGARVLRVDRAYPGQARNVGAAHAKYPFLAFWDASMWVAPSCLEHLMAPLLQNQADLVQGHLQICPQSLASQLTFLVLMPPYTHQIAGQPFYAPPVACTAFPKALWEAVGGFRPWRAREDSDFRQRIEALGVRVHFEPQAITHWEPAETFRSLLRKVRLYGRHNLLSGKPQDWYGGLFRVYGLYATFTVGAVTWGGAWGILAFPLLMLAGGALRTLRRVWRFGPYLRPQLTRPPWHPFTLLNATGLLLATDVASFAGLLDWLLKDRLRLNPETFPEPRLLT